MSIKSLFGSPGAAPDTARSSSSMQISSDAVLRRAQEIGIYDPQFYWVAKDSLKVPLPENWVECQTEDGYTYYYNHATETSVWDHPLLEQFRSNFQNALDAKAEAEKASPSVDVTPQKSFERSRLDSESAWQSDNYSVDAHSTVSEKSATKKKGILKQTDGGNDKDYWYERCQDAKKENLALQQQLEDIKGEKKKLESNIEELSKKTADHQESNINQSKIFAEKEQLLVKAIAEKEQKWMAEKSDLETRMQFMVAANKNSLNDAKRKLEEKESQIDKLAKLFEEEKKAKKNLENRLETLINEQSAIVKSQESEMEHNNSQIQHWHRLYEDQKRDKKNLEEQLEKLQLAMINLKGSNASKKDKDALKAYETLKESLANRASTSCEFLLQRGHQHGITLNPKKDSISKTCDNISRLLDCIESIISSEQKPGKASKVDDALFANTSEGLRLRLEKEFKNCLITDDKGVVIDIQHLKLRNLLQLMADLICRYGPHVLESDRGSSYLNAIVEHICILGKDSTLVPIKFVTIHKALHTASTSGEQLKAMPAVPSGDLASINRMEYLQMQEELAEHKKKSTKLSEMNVEFNKEITELRNKLTVAETRIEDQKIREDSLLSKFSELSSNLKLLRPGLKDQPEFSAKEYNILRSRIADLETELNVANKRSADAEKNLEEILQRDAELQAGVKSLEISIGQKLEKKKSKIIQLNRKVEELEKVSKDIYAELQKSKAILSETGEENSALKSRLEELAVHDKAADKLKVALQDETSRVKSLEHSNQKFRNENADLLEAVTKSRKLIQGLEDQLHDIRLELEHRESDILRLRKRFAFVEEEKKAFEAKYREAKMQVLRLNDRLMDVQGNIRVICRIRPLSIEEYESNHTSKAEVAKLVKVVDVNIVELNGNVFEVDRVFGPDSTQTEIFSDLEPLVRASMNGYRSCILAYGQTGSGKTHTMVGPGNDWGVYYRAFGFIFETIQRDIDTFRYSIQLSIVEIYNEKVYDLLGPNSLTNDVLDLQLQSGMICVEGVSIHNVHTLHDIKTHYNQADLKRRKSSGGTAEHSARSHLVILTSIYRENIITGDKTSGLLYFVDLAGSERGKLTSTSNQRLKESQHISKSLSSLHDVLLAMVRNQKQVPYRNSKLTYLLQNVIRENSKVAIVTNINPLPSQLGESTHSLTFCGQCRSVALGGQRLNYFDPNSGASRSSAKAMSRLMDTYQDQNNANETVVEIEDDQ